MEIFKKEEKKVSYLELIYDLIFVYMVGRDNALLYNMHNGFFDSITFVSYIITTLSIIQIWNFTVFYVNMFGRNGLRDHIFLLSNMYLMYFIGEATRTNAFAYIEQYHIAWGLILLNIGFQYIIELRNHKMDIWNQDIIRRMSFTLFFEAVFVFIAAFLPAYPALIISALAIFIGVLFTGISKTTSTGGQVDFMHLTERAMLYVVFTFGEMIIAVASYFTGGGHFDLTVIYYSFMTFMIAVGLFLSYEIIYDNLVNREGNYNGMKYIMLHIFIIFCLNNITLSFEFMRESEIALYPKILFLSLSLIGYFLFLFLLSGHFKIQCRPNKPFAIKMTLISVVFFLFMIHFENNMAVNVFISIVYTWFIFGILYRIKINQEKYIQNLKEDTK